MDLVIECSNINLSKKKDLAVRLYSEQDIPSLTKKGRVEVQQDGEWGAICSLESESAGFTANLLCKTMDFDSGKALAFNCLDKKDPLYPLCRSNHVLQSINCPVDALSLSQCAIESSPECADDTVLIECEGEKGDPSGFTTSPEELQSNPLLG